MGWTTFQIEKDFDIKRVTLQTWQRSGFIRPSLEEATGKGSKNRYSEADVCRILLFKALTVAGLEQKTAAKYTNEVESWDFSDETRYLCIVRSRRGELTFGVEKRLKTPPSSIDGGPVAIVIDLEQIRAEAAGKH